MSCVTIRSGMSCVTTCTTTQVNIQRKGRGEGGGGDVDFILPWTFQTVQSDLIEVHSQHLQRQLFPHKKRSSTF